METLLVRINPAGNIKLSDDQIVHDFMTKLMEKQEDVKGYHFERDEEGFINILMYGEIGE